MGLGAACRGGGLRVGRAALLTLLASSSPPSLARTAIAPYPPLPSSMPDPGVIERWGSVLFEGLALTGRTVLRGLHQTSRELVRSLLHTEKLQSHVVVFMVGLPAVRDVTPNLHSSLQESEPNPPFLP